ncbi:DnaD domain protein [Streptococcus oralis]|uniref:Helicase loader DnaB n=1 Tax=Streptococcus oralis TaxID=1303 RepID=A0A139R086_STROR|nr:DnaD domain protein [Streptococcus oralis]KXU08168.1 Helicase loader DnaB [Streptococcus oralis]
MKPNDRFSFLKNNRVSQDTSSLVQCYLPIIGQEALSLYLYAITFWDGGQKEHLFANILNHLNFGMNTLLQSFKILSAVDLLTLYQKGETYELQLHPPLSSQDFLSHSVYSRLLEKKIGDTAVSAMKQAPSEGEALSVSLSQVFPTLTEEVTPTESKSKLKNDFDLEHFQRLMARDGLRFEDEQTDVLELFAITDEKKWTWFETYQLAKATAVAQVISVKRMREKIAQKQVSSDFSPKEMAIIREVKNKIPQDFLQVLKQERKGYVTQSERELLHQMTSLGLLDEVINIVLLLTFNKVDSANVNEKYAMKVANDYAYQKIRTAEEAVLRIREHQQKGKEEQKNKASSTKTNVPKWSQPDYKNKTSAQELEEMERRTQELLAKLDNGGA